MKVDWVDWEEEKFKFFMHLCDDHVCMPSMAHGPMDMYGHHLNRTSYNYKYSYTL